MASTDEDKRRTQEASDGKFSRGSGGEDENEAATVVDSSAPALADGPLTPERALQRLRPLTDCCSARDLLILSCLSTKTAACATPAVWRRLRDREWAALSESELAAAAVLGMGAADFGESDSDEELFQVGDTPPSLWQPLFRSRRETEDAAQRHNSKMML